MPVFIVCEKTRRRDGRVFHIDGCPCEEEAVRLVAELIHGKGVGISRFTGVEYDGSRHWVCFDRTVDIPGSQLTVRRGG